MRAPCASRIPEEHGATAQGIPAMQSVERRARFNRVPLPYRILAVQLVVALLVASLLWWWWGAAAGRAAIAAGVVAVLPNTLFAWRVLAVTPQGVAESVAAARRVLAGAVFKIVLTVALLVVVFARVRPEPLVFFGVLILVQFVYWLAPVLDGPPRSRERTK